MYFHLRMLAAIILMSVASINAFAQNPRYYFYYDNEPADGVTPMERYHTVTPSGNVTLNAFNFYSYASEKPGLEDIPTNFVGVNFSVSLDYLTPAMDEMPYEITWPEPGLGIFKGMLPKGYYRNIRWNFKWVADGKPVTRTYHSEARFVTPNVARIPVYVYAGALNNPLYNQESVLIDMMEIRLRFKDMGHKVSSLLMGLRENMENNYGCPGLVDFRFYGYVEGVDGTMDFGADAAKLPPGLTVVPTISRCGQHVGSRILGCASIHGDKIAIAEDVLISGQYASDKVILHEYGHAVGLDHQDDPSGLVMSSTYGLLNEGILKKECIGFGRQKQFVSPEPWKTNL